MSDASPPPYRIRRAEAGDVPSLARLYESTVRALGPACYSPEQIEAWSAYGRDPAFHDFIMTAATFVAVVADEPVGFCGLMSDGRVASLYVSERHVRRGIGSALLARVLQLARSRGMAQLHTDASEFSRPVFARHGFTVDQVERVERGGVTFHRYRMVLRLDCTAGAAGQ